MEYSPGIKIINLYMHVLYCIVIKKKKKMKKVRWASLEMHSKTEDISSLENCTIKINNAKIIITFGLNTLLPSHIIILYTSCAFLCFVYSIYIIILYFPLNLYTSAMFVLHPVRY